MNNEDRLKENVEVTFQEYIQWVFEQNEHTYKDVGNLSIQQTNLVTTAIQEHQILDITWLFRKCRDEISLNKQNQAFNNLSHIIRHIFLFLLLLVKKKQEQTKLNTLMNSIGMKNEDTILAIYLADPNLSILNQKYALKLILQQGNNLQNNFRMIFQIWCELKDAKVDGLKLPESDNSFLQEFQRLHACLNMDSALLITVKNKEKKQQKEREIQLEKQINEQRLFQSSLRKEKIHSVKIMKIDCKKSYSLFLQPNGNIVKGKFWFPQNSLHLCPLWLSFNNEIFSFCNLNNLNSDLRLYCGFISYKGPVNDYFEPHTYDFDNETEGIMNTCSENILFKGRFKNGLFDGKNNRLYLNDLLFYYGEFKNGQKHGEGYTVEYYPQHIYMKGQYESNLKQGPFIDYKAKDLTQREKIFEKNGSKLEYYKNGIKYDKVPTDIQQYYASQNPSCNLLNFNEYGINNFQLASLRPGGWINSSVIDILLNQLISLVNYSNFTQQNIRILKTKTYFINCSQFQDIFGSMVTKDEKINHKIFNQIYDQGQSYLMKDNQTEKNIDKDIRIVFYFNLDRSHFLSAVYESQKLYLIDSLQDKRKAVLFQMTQFLQQLGLNVKEQYDSCKISQQQNSYDCGAYTIYYVSQIIKNQHLTIQQMIEKKYFEIAQSQINYLRYLIYQNLIGNGASIMEL